MNEAMTPKQIVDQILFEQRLNVNQFAKKVGVSATNLYDVMSGKIKAISNEMADKIRAVFPNYSKAWLMTGEGNAHIEETMPIPEEGSDAPGSTSVHINDARTTGDIVKICNAFISEMAAQREAYSQHIDRLLNIIDKRLPTAQ